MLREGKRWENWPLRITEEEVLSLGRGDGALPLLVFLSIPSAGPEGLEDAISHRLLEFVGRHYQDAARPVKLLDGAWKDASHQGQSSIVTVRARLGFAPVAVLETVALANAGDLSFRVGCWAPEQEDYTYAPLVEMRWRAMAEANARARAEKWRADRQSMVTDGLATTPEEADATLWRPRPDQPQAPGAGGTAARQRARPGRLQPYALHPGTGGLRELPSSPGDLALSLSGLDGGHLPRAVSRHPIRRCPRSWPTFWSETRTSPATCSASSLITTAPPTGAWCGTACRSGLRTGRCVWPGPWRPCRILGWAAPRRSPHWPNGSRCGVSRRRRSRRRWPASSTPCGLGHPWPPRRARIRTTWRRSRAAARRWGKGIWLERLRAFLVTARAAAERAAAETAERQRLLTVPQEIHGWSTARVQGLQLMTAQALGLTAAAFAHRLRDGGQGPEMLVIPAGRFLMGSPASETERFDEEGPQHSITFAHPFAIGRYAVTFVEYDAFCTKTGRSKPGDEGWGRDQRPAINVSWDDALAYCAWLSAQTGRTYRLPSEAEWEYAARAGTASVFWWGSRIDPSQANYDGNYVYGDGPKGEYRQSHAAGGELPAQPLRSPSGPWQRLGVVPGPLARKLRGRADGRFGLGVRRGAVPRAARRLLEPRPGGLPRGLPPPQPRRSPLREHRFSGLLWRPHRLAGRRGAER